VGDGQESAHRVCSPPRIEWSAAGSCMLGAQWNICIRAAPIVETCGNNAWAGFWYVAHLAWMPCGFNQKPARWALVAVGSNYKSRRARRFLFSVLVGVGAITTAPGNLWCAFIIFALTLHFSRTKKIDMHSARETPVELCGVSTGAQN